MLEENLTLNDGVTLYQLKDFETFKEYGYETSVYALTKLIEADFLNGSVSRTDNKIDYIGVGSITWDGHQLLDQTTFVTMLFGLKRKMPLSRYQAFPCPYFQMSEKALRKSLSV
ncbi:DUF2513 domain-containing protein [Bacillus safensis]|uniref:DUF2513 domain-containing protein n=1 Tax=Bacillus safensis TaxID=561879 RepID=UPI001E30F113|nr:DUF2513 domain-containing protein [Bacillus safensis]